jgi:cytochrome c oxidase accessory protein FixG
MIVVERFWQGDRNQRIALGKRPCGPIKLFKKGMTHLSWLIIGLATGGAFVFYFRDAPTLAQELLTGKAPTIAYLFLGIFTMTTYVLGGIAREQVCIYMCPWPRIQGAMVDHETLLVGYKDHRGEPRGPHKKGQTWEGRGDCIDCQACVAVCPMGIDIRDGSQLECIQCALCIDACNDIMSKIGRPPNLVAYDTIANQEATLRGEAAPLQIIRPRTLLYTGLIIVVSAIMLVVLLNRTTLEINVLHDRNPPYVMLSDGGVRNGYTIKILNKLHEPREFTLEAKGLAGAQLSMVGLEPSASIRVTTDDVRELRAFVTLSKTEAARHAPGSVPFWLVVRDATTGSETFRGVNFHKPAATPARSQ